MFEFTNVKELQKRTILIKNFFNIPDEEEESFLSKEELYIRHDKAFDRLVSVLDKNNNFTIHGITFNAIENIETKHIDIFLNNNKLATIKV